MKMQQPWPKPLLCGIGACSVILYRPARNCPTKTICLLTTVLVLVLSPFARGQFTIPDGYQNPANLQLANGNLYFTAKQANPNDTLMSVPISGGTATPVVTGLTNIEGNSTYGINAYTVDGPNVYGGYGGYASYTIFSAPSVGGTSTSLASPSGGYFIGETGGNIYHGADFNTINTIPTSGGISTPVAHGVWVRSATIDNAGIYFQNYFNKGIYNFDFATHNLTPIISLSQETGMFNDSQNVYLNDFGNGIIAVPKTGGPAHTVVAGSNITGYTASAGYVYYTNGKSILQISSSGGPAVTLTTSNTNVTSMATNGQALYFSTAASIGGSANIRTTPLSVPLVVTNRTPTLAPPTSEGRLLVFDVATQSWSPTLLPQQGENTIVLTSGWNPLGLTSPSQDWPLTMAKDLTKTTKNVNIVTWDWQTVAAQPYAGMQTQAEGAKLALALENELPNTTAQFHFIGHSLGTLINRQAIDALATAGVPEQHIGDTILDAPEHIPSMSALPPGLTSTNSNPIPTSVHLAYIDNYITSFGDTHDQAQNVYLPVGSANGLIGWHGYAEGWYNDSITNGVVTPAGYGNTPTSGTYYLQNVVSPSEVISSSKGVLQSLLAVRDLDANKGKLLLLTVDALRAEVQISGNVIAKSVVTLGTALSTDGTPTYVTTPQFILNGHAGSSAWVPVHFPSDASGLSFNSLFQDVPSGDSLVVGIDNQILFTVDGQFVTNGSTFSSGVLDISQWQGRDVEIYFGLFPGSPPTSPGMLADTLPSNESVTIDSISFISVPEPHAIAAVALGLLALRRMRSRCG